MKKLQKKIFAVIGNPVSHSKSPDIYNYLFKKYNIDGTYIAIELNEENIEQFLKEFAKGMNLKGVNVTMPLKEKAATLSRRLDSLSGLLKTVNTLDLTTGTGYTTDGKGLLLSLNYQGFDITGKNVVVIGAGGAAKSICYEIARSKVNSLTILNRTLLKAKELADIVGGAIKTDDLSKMDEYMHDCDLLINCTSIGMKGNDFEDLSFIHLLKKNSFVYDIIYEPRKTGLLKEAEKNNIKCCNGLDMLICQAFYAFEIFAGIMPDKEERDELLNIL